MTITALPPEPSSMVHCELPDPALALAIPNGQYAPVFDREESDIQLGISNSTMK
jgi:hypothetical protein